jgi:hypothetical protein
MECRDEPCDAPASSEATTIGKLKFELDDRARRNAFCSESSKATKADVGAAAEWRDRFAIEGREVKPRVKPDALRAAV